MFPLKKKINKTNIEKIEKMNTYNSACNSCIKIMTTGLWSFVIGFLNQVPSLILSMYYVTCILVLSITLVLHVIKGMFMLIETTPPVILLICT